METATHTVLDCGHEPTNTGSASLPGYAKDAHGSTRCYACAEQIERTRFLECGEKREPFVAYLSGDEKVRGSLKVTTWTGAVIAEVTAAHKIKAPRGDTIHGSHMLAFTARDSLGREWYGRGSPGIVVYLRRKGK